MTLPDALVWPPIAHRGLWRPGEAPENSLAAFDIACRSRFGVELDVRLSADGEAVVFHDERLERLTGVDAAVVELSAMLALAEGIAPTPTTTAPTSSAPPPEGAGPGAGVVVTPRFTG